ncbi:hypothetical protein [Vibrio stylophorae]|nr:hypothetical protein [Vibrio stylophorae]
MKLCRESLSVYASKNEQEVVDCFFNFCVTAHSLRDWCIKVSSATSQDFHDYCNTFDTLEMCRDIANSSKHFGLDGSRASTVSEIDEKELKYVPFGTNDSEGGVIKPSLEIVTDEGQIVNLKDFLNDTVESWVKVFDRFSIQRDQKFTYTGSLEVQVEDYVISLI